MPSYVYSISFYRITIIIYGVSQYTHTGVYAGQDISYCSPEELDTIAAFLKAIPRRNFFKALGIEKN